jgi:hypothetical protein
MPPLPNPHVSPLHSFASRPDVVPRYVSFSETIGAIIAWLRGDRLTARERQIEAATVERLAEELADEEAAGREE